METLLEKEMFNYFNQLNESDQKSVIQILKVFVDDGDENSERVTLEQYNKEIDEAMDRVNQGDYITIEELKKEMKSW